MYIYFQKLNKPNLFFKYESTILGITAKSQYFNKSEKTKEMRQTNIQAAKGNILISMSSCIGCNKNQFWTDWNGQNDLNAKHQVLITNDGATILKQLDMVQQCIPWNLIDVKQNILREGNTADNYFRGISICFRKCVQKLWMNQKPAELDNKIIVV
ncbi:unnamed protein product [Paramecium octaurelia]|uniref:Uncharacterized protein n=1 Tax=Paramecium octaurelia TaxID=43137 RepID=A0A8S1TY92_PAROT|nr:unnamed protein product [Paramecium octaurelia]